jgi:outer membrane lipoprotein SlyB
MNGTHCIRLLTQQHTEAILNTYTTRNSALALLTVISLLAFSGCSQKSSSEEIAAQVKAALAEEKAKEQAAAAAASAAAVAPAPETKVETLKPVSKPDHPSHAKPVHAQAAPTKKIFCENCGEVISVKEIEQKGKGSGLGVIAGGVAGGVVGNQVGQGTGRDLATIAGLVGGAIAGNKIEENMKKTKAYDVAVQMENGEERVLHFDTAPGVMAGDKVKVEGEHITRQ